MGEDYLDDYAHIREGVGKGVNIDMGIRTKLVDTVSETRDRLSVYLSTIDRKDLLIAFALFLISVCIYWYFLVPSATHTSDVLATVYPAELLVDGKSTNMYNPLNSLYDTYGFASEGKYLSTTELFSTKYPGTIMFVASFIWLFGSGSYFYLSGLMGGTCVFAIYYLCSRTLSDRRMGVLGALTLMTMPVFMKWSIDNFDTLIQVCFITLSIVSLFVLKGRYRYLVVGALYGFSVFIRPDSIVILPAFIIYIYLTKPGWNNLVKFFVPLMIVVSVYPLMDLWLYGDPFFLGGAMGDSWPVSVTENVPTDRIWAILSWNGAGWALLNSAEYFLTSLFAFPLLFVALMGLAYTAIAKKEQRALVAFIFLVTLFLWLFYGKTVNTHAFGEVNLHSSFIRYMLPAYVLLPLGVVSIVSLIQRRFKGRSVQMASLFLVILMLAGSFSYALIMEPYGINHLNQQREWIIDAKEEVLAYTNETDVFISDVYAKKMLYPERQNVFNVDRVPDIIRINETIRVIGELLEDNRTVYLGFANFPESTVTMQSIIEMEYSLERVNFIETRYVFFYRIVPLTSSVTP